MQNYAVRLNVENAEVVEATLNRVGTTGERALSRIDSAARPAAGSTKLLGASFEKMSTGNIERATRSVGGFVSEVVRGQSVTESLTRRLPTLLASFGALGAVIGGGVALGIPLLTSAITSLRGESETLEDRMRRLVDSTAAVRNAQRDADLTTQQLVATYGAATAEVRGLIAAQLQLARDNALRAAIDLLSSSFERFADVRQIAIDGVNPFEVMTTGARRLRDELQLTEPVAEAIQRAIVEGRASQELESQAEALARIRGLLEDQRDEYGNLTPAAAEMYRAVLDTERQIRLATGAVGQLAGETDFARRAANDLQGAWAGVVRAVSAATAGAAAARQEAEIRLRTAGNPVATAGALAGNRFDALSGDITGLDPILQEALRKQRAEMIADAEATAQLQEQIAAMNRSEPAARSGGGAAKRVIEERASAADRVIESLERELDMIGKTDLARRISTELRAAEVSALDGQGAKITELVTRLSELEEAQRRVDEVNELVASSMSDLFGDMITGAASARDAIGQLIGELGRMALSKGFTSLFSGLAVGGTGLGNTLGSLFLPGFATGGSFRVGGGGGTDSQVVAFRATPGEMVDVRRPGQSGGGTVLNFAPTINAPGADREGMAQVRAELAAMRDSFRDKVAEATSNPWRRGAV